MDVWGGSRSGKGAGGGFSMRGRHENHQAVVSSAAPLVPDVISPGGALAITTIAGRSSRPFSVQTGVQACITLPGV